MSYERKSFALQHMKLLQFELQADNYWTKCYRDCEIKVDLQHGKIIYPEEKMEVHDQSTSNLNDDEDFVVLECVDRLLNHGYPAEKIELEKRWKVGKDKSGKLDVLVRSKDSNGIYLMIECKTLTIEYQREKKRMLKNNGQLFSYFQQDRSAEFICLYASGFVGNRFAFEYSAIPIDDSLRYASSMDAMFEKWDKKFKEHGLFDSEPYQIQLSS